MITLSQLAEELRNKEIFVEERTLKDWREEGLLPRPPSRGKGRGKGRTPGQHELDVIDRAVDIYALKRRRRRFKNAHHLELFALGYSVPYQELKVGVRSWLA